MKGRPMKSAPLDRPILVEIDGEWTQAKWRPGYGDDDEGEFDVVRMDSHGCGCCAGTNPKPTRWASLPE